MTPVVRHVVVGPARHGVVRHGLGLHRAAAAPAAPSGPAPSRPALSTPAPGGEVTEAPPISGDGRSSCPLAGGGVGESAEGSASAEAGQGAEPGRGGDDRRLEHRLVRWPDGVPSSDQVRRDLAPEDGGMVHVSFTDHLFGPAPAAAARAVVDLAGGLPLSVGVHDVPQLQEGRERWERRRAGYRQLVEAAAVVIANSAHEAAQLVELSPGIAGRVRTVPLPLEAPVASVASAPGAMPPAQPSGTVPPGSDDRRGGAPVVGLLGFLYPGKGYEAVLDAVAPGAVVRALGAVAAGHDDWAARLREQAARRGVVFEVTGFIPDDRLAAQLAAVDVPICPHRHVSASGSLNTWIAHGRVPVALDGPYMREVAQRWPGRVLLSSAERLPAVVQELTADPRPTWAQAQPPAWGWAEVARACEASWRELVG